MKFGNYLFSARGIDNIGDNLQIIAIDYIYQEMGVDKNDVVYIDKNELAVYNGEYIILPVTMPLVDYTMNGIAGRFSDHIIPVFIGLTIVKDTLLPEEISYYHRFEPIGCRDERTLNTLRKYGITSYLHGCITVTLPERIDGIYNEVYIVDAPESLMSYIPDYLKNNAIYRTHMHSKLSRNPKDVALEYYNEYKRNAKLVITSLLHCAVPCMAAGIPVILAKEKCSYRFSWLEQLLPIYTFDEFEKIDWNPKKVNYVKHKKDVLDLTKSRLFDVYSKYSAICDISWTYESREKKHIYIVDAFESIKNYIDTHFQNKCVKYSIWGLTQIAECAVNYISENYPNATLMHVYDKYRTMKFYDLMSQTPDNIRNNSDEIILVTTNGAKTDAERLFLEINKNPDSYAFVEIIK